MINWREGKGGFVGGAKRLIKGVFQYSYTITSVVVGIGDVINPRIKSLTLQRSITSLTIKRRVNSITPDRDITIN